MSFRVFPAFDDPSLRWAASSRFRLDRASAQHFGGPPLAARIVQALAERRAIKVKEVLESFETFERVRRRLRAAKMADLCCGHGLTGLLFAAFERSVDEIVLLDRKKPEKAEDVFAAVRDAAPWIEGKVRWIEDKVARAADHLAPGTSVIAIHACGSRTDRVIDAALALDGDLAVVPCCYTRTADHVPRALRQSLGVELAADVDRTYRLESQGYRVEWTTIPDAITPMNRVLLARAPRNKER